MFLGIDPSLVGTGVIGIKDNKIVRKDLIKTKPIKTNIGELERLLSIVEKINLSDVIFVAIEDTR